MIEHEWYFLHEYWFKKYIRGHRIHNLDLYHIQPLPEGQNIYIVAQRYETYWVTQKLPQTCTVILRIRIMVIRLDGCSVCLAHVQMTAQEFWRNSKKISSLTTFSNWPEKARINRYNWTRNLRIVLCKHNCIAKSHFE